jgi:glucokinase
MSVAPVLAFDVGGTNLRGALVGRDGTLFVDRRVSSDGLSPDGLAATAVELADDLERAVGVRAERVGAGVAAMLPKPGEVIENAPNLGWRDAPLKRLLEDALGRPTWLFNDVDAICVGEARSGAAAGASDVACAFLGTGLGSGFVVDGRLVRGFRGVAAELGHIKVEPQGRVCACGERGCLEAYVGGAALLKRITEAGDDAAAPRALAADAPPDVSHVDRAADEGDTWSSALWDEVAGRVALALANAITLFNPEVLVLGGGVFAHAPGLLARTRQRVPALCSSVARDGLRIVDAALGDDAGLIGAAWLAREAS